MLTDIPTLFKTGGTHLYALMGHVDGHFVVFLCRNSYIPRTNRKNLYFFSFFFISSFLLKLTLCSFLNQVHTHRLNTKKHENSMMHFALNRPYIVKNSVSSSGTSNASQHAKYAEVRQIRQIQKQRFQKHVLHCGITKTTTMGTSKNKLFSSTPNTLQHAKYVRVWCT